jgi:uncharacterized protein (TIGR03437 family)
MKVAGLSLLLFLSPVFAQTPSVVTSMGYSNPAPVAVAPGQVITLFAYTKTKLEKSIAASGTTLPTTLGGFSVSLSQTFSKAAIPVPILSVTPVQTYTAISVEIPFELVPNAPRSRLPENSATLTISDNGDIGEPIALHPVSDRIHIVDSCDTPLNAQSGPCGPVFQHSDGSLVSAENPAVRGETITLQAYGLGYADSQVATGAFSPSPAVSVSDVSMDFRFGTDPAVTRPDANATTLAAQLVPGTVGLYQMAFTVPALPDGTAACSAVTNNLTVVIARGASFHGASLCVRQ